MRTRAHRLIILGMHYRPEVTGNAPYTAGLAEALAADDCEVTVACAHPHYPEWKIREGYGAWRSEEDLAGVRVVRLRHWVPRDPKSLARLVSELSFGIRQALTGWRRPDVVLLVSPALFSSAIAMVRARFSRVRRVVWVQDVYSAGAKEIGGANGIVLALIRRIESWTLRSASSVVVIHDTFRRTVIDELRVSPEKVVTIRNWSHVGTASRVDRAAIRVRQGWRDDEFIALHAGNQGQKQGLENLVAAGRIIDELKLPIRLILLGDGNQNARLRALARGVDSVQFMDPVDDDRFLDVLESADALVVNEQVGVAEMSVPSKLTSYFSTGRPVVGACAEGGGAATELAASGGGVRVDPGQPSALVEQLVAIQKNPEEFEVLGTNGLAYRNRLLGLDAAERAFRSALFG